MSSQQNMKELTGYEIKLWQGSRQRLFCLKGGSSRVGSRGNVVTLPVKVITLWFLSANMLGPNPMRQAAQPQGPGEFCFPELSVWRGAGWTSKWKCFRKLILHRKRKGKVGLSKKEQPHREFSPTAVASQGESEQSCPMPAQDCTTPFKITLG